jgi:uncharacterized protein DUF3575
MNLKRFLVLAVCLLIASMVNAAEGSKFTLEDKDIKIAGFKQSINSCPGGLIFGVYSLNYERLIAPKHGLVARFDYEDISEKYSGDKFRATGMGFILNYRRHFSPSLKSIYLGSYARYRIYDGTGEDEAVEFDFDITEFTIGLNAGKRWVWSSGFNINFMLGYGVAFTDTDVESSFESAYDKFTDKYSFEGPMLGEFSIGWAF